MEFVWIYFHSNIQEFNKIECLGLLKEAASISSYWASEVHGPTSPQPYQESYKCGFPLRSLISGPISSDLYGPNGLIHQGL